jgi:hypothetical protein
MNNNLPFAEDTNYFQTSQSSADAWIAKTQALIKEFGGKVLAEAYGSENGRAAFMLEFEMQGEHFKIIWPVLPSRARNDKAAKIQAATLLYHDIKNSLLKVKIFGARTALFQYWMLPDGRNVSQATREELAQNIPTLFAPMRYPQIEAGGDVIDSDYRIIK